MSELRAPDPTLTALSLAVRVDTTVPVPVAHKDNHGAGAYTPTSFARWYAVPCRECFPDAPPRGTRETRGGVLIKFEGLAWQVAP